MGTRKARHRWPVYPDTPLHQAFYVEFRIRPIATSMVCFSVSIGGCALVLGEGASRAFTIIGGEGGGGALIAHLMGALMLLGGLISLAGALRIGLFVEALGLVFVAAGAAIYGAGVLIGLGVNGLIAGQLALGLAIGAGGRVLLLLNTAKKLANDS